MEERENGDERLCGKNTVLREDDKSMVFI